MLFFVQNCRQNQSILPSLKTSVRGSWRSCLFINNINIMLLLYSIHVFICMFIHVAVLIARSRCLCSPACILSWLYFLFMFTFASVGMPFVVSTFTFFEVFKRSVCICEYVSVCVCVCEWVSACCVLRLPVFVYVSCLYSSFMWNLIGLSFGLAFHLVGSMMMLNMAVMMVIMMMMVVVMVMVVVTCWFIKVKMMVAMLKILRAFGTPDWWCLLLRGSYYLGDENSYLTQNVRT